MLLHLESGNCNTDIEVLDKIACECYQSTKYTVPDSRTYLLEGHRRQLRGDIVYHHYTQSYECDICGASWDTVVGARLHSQSPVHDPCAFKCPSCDERFRVLSALVQHVESDRCDEGLEEGTGSIGKMLHYLWLRL